MMNDTNNTSILEEAQTLETQLKEIELAKRAHLDEVQMERSHFNCYMRQQVSCIQDMKFDFNGEVTRLRQEMARLRHEYRMSLSNLRHQIFSVVPSMPTVLAPSPIPSVVREV